MTGTPAKKSDLGVRTLSAIVMLAVAGAALWQLFSLWPIFVWAVGALCFAEFARLIWLSVNRPWLQAALLLAGAAYIGWATHRLATLPGQFSWDSADTPAAIRLFIVSLVGVVITTDVGAYFTGRSIGGPKIAPRISPSKTWAGLGGGMLAAALWSILVAVVLSRWFSWNTLEAPGAVWLAALAGATLAIVAQCGDFLESWMKRKAGLKDSSNLIPGHGGVFDRIDGLLPVVIVAGWLPFGPY
jgi:phosphatidate cytidylyltransferase